MQASGFGVLCLGFGLLFDMFCMSEVLVRQAARVVVSKVSEGSRRSVYAYWRRRTV